MKTDRKLWAAIIILIALVAWLVVISLQKASDTDKALKEIEQLKQSISVEPKVTNGINGKSPILGVDYTVQNGSNGTPGLQGATGLPGTNGLNGQNGAQGSPGLSAYDIAVENGFIGTQSQWLLSLQGNQGPVGPSLVVSCINNLINTQYIGDAFWQPTNIKCKTAGSNE